MQGRKKAIEYFESAIAKDSQFAAAYAALARTYLQSSGSDEQARIAVNMALSLDPVLAETHEVLGEILFWRDKNFDAASAQFQQAIQFEPGRASARLAYANYLSAAGDFDGAIQQAALARSLEAGVHYRSAGA